jgi:hypothetical protein
METEMRIPHLFEFMDLEWLPTGLRITLREVLQTVLSAPFRSYYDWVAREVLTSSRARGIRTIVELGAGTAPITQRLLESPDADELHFLLCDVNPDRSCYAELEARHPGRVSANYESVAFGDPPCWPSAATLVLSASLHHVPRGQRADLLKKLAVSADHLLVFEPLRQTIPAVGLTLFTFAPGLIAPLIQIHKSGRARRFLWCWLLPLAPFMLTWDSVVSCLRQWSEYEWRQELIHAIGKKGSYTVNWTTLCQKVSVDISPVQ